MFKISDIYESYCEEREALEKYEEFEREYITPEVSNKLWEYMEEHKYDLYDKYKFIRKPEFIEDIGENHQRQIVDIVGNRTLLDAAHTDCVCIISNSSKLLRELGRHMETSAVEEMIAATYMLCSLADTVANKLYSHGYPRYEKVYFSVSNGLAGLLKQVSQKSLEEVVQEYCSNW